MATGKRTRPIPVAKARSFLSYDPDTGLLRWKVSRGRMAAGQVAGVVKSDRGYVSVRIDGTIFYAHRVAYVLHTGQPIPDGMEIDHRDGNPTNNRWDNLRLATPVQNKRNMRASSRNTSGVTGVCFDKRCGRWVAQMSIRNRCVFLGYFDNIADAAAARRKAERETFGEFSPRQRPAA